MADQTPFQVNPNNFLGLEYATYRKKLYSIAISQPKEYVTQVSIVDSKVKKAAISQLYKTIFYLLTEGRIAAPDGSKGEQVIFDTLNGNIPLQPSYPSQKVNEICLGLSATMEQALDEIINYLLPVDFSQILSSKLTSQGNASIV